MGGSVGRMAGLVGAAVVGAGVLAAPAAAEIVTIDVDLGTPFGGGSYRLTGQSAFFITRTGGFSTGGQLDGAMTGGTQIQYEEFFPEPSLADYTGFGYFGRIETIDDDDIVQDVSLVVAFRAGFGVDAMIGDIFAGMNESALVAALETFDSDAFFDLLFAAVGATETRGELASPPIGREGETLILVAFTGGLDGDIGVAVGTIGVTVVPAAGPAGLLAVAGLVAVGRRRRA